MNAKLACLSVLMLSACAQEVAVAGIAAGDDLSGLSDYERREFEWGAIEVVIPAETAQTLQRWQLSNVSLHLSRCEEPSNYYPADARMNGTFFDPSDLEEQPTRPVTLTFYVPKHVQQREQYGCATLDARGYSPVLLTSQKMRLPAIRFGRTRAEEQPMQPTS